MSQGYPHTNRNHVDEIRRHAGGAAGGAAGDAYFGDART